VTPSLSGPQLPSVNVRLPDTRAVAELPTVRQETAEGRGPSSEAWDLIDPARASSMLFPLVVQRGS
jgi:hypothetical protein